MEKISNQLQQSVTSILQRRKAKEGRDSSESPPLAYQTLPEIGIDFEVEEEQVMKGLELFYQDKLNEADEYFETLKLGHPRFSLHHAEVASFVALISFEPQDIEFATTLLNETISLADQQTKRWQTHTNMKMVEEAMGAVKNWALTTAATALKIMPGPMGAQVSAKLMPTENAPTLDDDENERSSNREEANYNHRARRLRLWALLIQAECQLMIFLLQAVAAGESWTTLVKVGYSVRRCWSIYQHCQKKLAHLQQEWVSFGGTLTGTGPLKSLSAESDSDEDPQLTYDLGHLSNVAGSSSQQTRRSQNYDPQVSAPEGEMIYQGIRAAATNLEKLEENIKEDQELASLRIGIQFGVGAFNLIMSLIPTNYQKAVELMALPNDRNIGLSLLRKVSSLHHCRAPLASIILLNYFTTVMGLLPFSTENSTGARNILNMLPFAWKESSIFKSLQARLTTYELSPQEANRIIKGCLKDITPSNDQTDASIPIKRLFNMLTDDHAWNWMLLEEFTQAYEKFKLIFKDTQALKLHYGCLMMACCCEVGGTYQQEAIKLMHDLPKLFASKSTVPTPLEHIGLRHANAFINNGQDSSKQIPLFPALEIMALYNGFQHMDKITLKRHLDRLNDGLMNQSLITTSKARPSLRGSEIGAPPSYEEVMKTMVPGEAVGGHKRIPFQSRSKSPHKDEEVDEDPSSSNGFHHKWSKESEVLCRFLIALCQRSLGDLKQAESNFRFVVAQTEIAPGDVIPYACFEWGSMFLSNEATSTEGLNLLEKSVNYPYHDFQTRLKFIVSERLRMFRKACENKLNSQASTTSALNLRRVSELLRTVPYQPPNSDEDLT